MKTIKRLLTFSLLGLVACNSQPLKNQISPAPDSIPLVAEHENYDTLISRGRKYFYEGKYVETMLVANKAIQMDSARVEGYYILGVVDAMKCHLKKESCAEGIAAFTKVIQINPKYKDSYYNRALCRTGLNDYKNALDDLNKAIDLNPSDPEYFYNRGVVFSLMHDNESACKDFQQSIKLGGQMDAERIKIINMSCK